MKLLMQNVKEKLLQFNLKEPGKEMNRMHVSWQLTGCKSHKVSWAMVAQYIFKVQCKIILKYMFNKCRFIHKAQTTTSGKSFANLEIYFS